MHNGKKLAEDLLPRVKAIEVQFPHLHPIDGPGPLGHREYAFTLHCEGVGIQQLKNGRVKGVMRLIITGDKPTGGRTWYNLFLYEFPPSTYVHGKCKCDVCSSARSNRRFFSMRRLAAMRAMAALERQLGKPWLNPCNNSG